MRLNPQPRGRRGTIDRPYSALNLRLLLAVFGVVVSAVLAVLVLRAGYPVVAALFGALALIAAVNVVVVQTRRRARRRAGDSNRSLFE